MVRITNPLPMITSGHILNGTISPIDMVASLYTKQGSYVIYIDTGVHYAINCETGENEFSDADAYTLIQAVIDALTSGGKIFIKAGTYTLTTPLNVKSDIHICGEGVTTVFTIANGEDIDLITSGNYPLTGDCDNIILENFKIDGNGANQASDGSNVFYGGSNIKIRNLLIDETYGTGILFRRCIDSIIENCVLINSTTADGINVYDGSDRVIIRNNTVKDNGGAFGIQVLGRENVAQNNSVDCIIANNIVTGSNAMGISCRQGVDRCLIIGNVTMLNQNDGIELYGATINAVDSPVKDCVIAGNISRDNQQGAGVYAGVRIWNGGAAGNACLNNIVIGNRCEGQDYGIYAINDEDWNHLHGNQLRGNGVAGIQKTGANSTNTDNLT